MMNSELVFSVKGSHVQAAVPVTLAEVGLHERDHLQAWVLAHPEILGSEVKIVAFEFDRWVSAPQTPTYDRLDVLGLDKTGRLVVGELKRDLAPHSVTMQAINYAAMVSRFSVDLLAEVYSSQFEGGRLTAEDALAQLLEWAPELSDESLRTPRIVLIAGEFPRLVTNTALFLYEAGIDISITQVKPYRTAEGDLVITVSRILPVTAAEDFMIRPRSSTHTQRAAASAKERRASIPVRLVQSGLLADGQPLQIVVPSGVGEDVVGINRWLDKDPSRRKVSWRQDPSQPVLWTVDEQPYNLTTLIKHVISVSTGQQPRTYVWGPNWYRDENDRVLHKIAEALP